MGVRPNTAPLPTGASVKKRGRTDTGANVAYPGNDNYLLPGDGSGAAIGPFNRPERFWLHAGGYAILYGPSWTSTYYKLRLVVNGAYNNDLNGLQISEKCTPMGGASDAWFGVSIEMLYYCEANTDYQVYLLAGGGGAGGVHYQWHAHWNMWGYTIGEGVY